jgi:hypothetical protein
MAHNTVVPTMMNPDNSVGIAAGCLKDDRGIGIHVSTQRTDRFWGPSSPLPNVYKGGSSGMKRQGYEADACCMMHRGWMLNALEW